MNDLKTYIIILSLIKNLLILPSNINLFLYLIYNSIILWFIYVTVEEFLCCKNKLLYTFKISFLSFVVGLINSFLTYIVFNCEIILYENIFLTIALGLYILTILFSENKEKYKIIKIIISVNLIFISMFITQYGYIIIPLMIIIYLIKDNIRLKVFLYFLLPLIIIKIF